MWTGVLGDSADANETAPGPASASAANWLSTALAPRGAASARIGGAVMPPARPRSVWTSGTLVGVPVTVSGAKWSQPTADKATATAVQGTSTFRRRRGGLDIALPSLLGLQQTEFARGIRKPLTPNEATWASYPGDSAHAGCSNAEAVSTV